MKRKAKLIGVVAVVAFIAAAGYMLGVYSEQTGTVVSLTQEAQAVGGAMEKEKMTRQYMTDPNGTVSNRFFYHPGTEALGPEEVRVTACGTGMPAARRGQAAACFLVELGNTLHG
jgi:ribonuclease Z